MKAAGLIALAIIIPMVIVVARNRHPDADRNGLSPNGFACIGMPAGYVEDVVFVFSSSCSCQEESQPAYEMIQELKRKKIPTEWIQSYSVDRDDGLPLQEHNEQVERTRVVFSGSRPIVMINGRGKANPTQAEVEAEYRFAVRHDAR